jgi:acyl CoA:acetate/3-ketoacid CoA transferase alpha subunit
MEIIIYFGLYLLITGLFAFYAFIDAPICDENGNIIEDSKFEKWKKKLKKRKK